jgi:hypothetical protein
MTMTNRFMTLGLVGLVFLGACSQMKGTPHPSQKAEKITIPGSMEESFTCPKGRFDLELLRNYAERDGKIEFFGRGGLWTKAVASGKAIPKDVAFADLGEELEFNFASAQPPSEIGEEQVRALRNPRSLMQTLQLVPSGKDSSLPLSVILKKSDKNFYRTDGQAGITLDALEMDTAAGLDATSSAGIGVQSLVTVGSLAKKAEKGIVAASLPASVDTAKEELATIKDVKLGDSIKIDLPNPSSAQGDFYTVHLQAKDKTWFATFRAPGSTKTIEIKTKWDKGGLKAGEVGIVISRSRLTNTQLKDGNLCVIASQGVFSMMNLKKQ